MSKKQESLRAELQKILNRGGRTVINKGSDGKAVPVPEEAEVFEFDFTKDGKSYGNVFVSIDGLHQLIVYFNDDVSNSPKNGSNDSESWEQLVRTLKRFAMMKQLSFKLANIDNLENDMAKREHTKRQEKMYEGYHAQGKKASYSDNVPTTKIIIKHKREMQEGEQRFRQIDKIFIENAIGERMLAPTDKPGLARVFARHIAEGGKANDERWNHISGLCEEYQKMAGFVRATRNGQFNESAQKLVAEGINHYQKLRECLGKMSGQRGYNSYFESYTPALMEDEASVDLSEMFMSSSLDPRIESVMPILSKLSKNINETTEMAETIALEEWASEIIGEAPEPTKSKPSKQEVAKKIHGILSKGKEAMPESVNEGHPSDNDMGTTTGGTKMTLGQWKQMWMKKMPKADYASLFRSPPNMQGSAIAYFDGWMNNPDARWDPQQGVAEDLDPEQKSAGQFSTKDKFAKPGSLVGANESKINEGVLDNVRNRMQSGSMLDRVRSGAYKKPAAPTPAPTQVAPTAPAVSAPPGYDTETGKPLPPEARFDPHTGKPLPGSAPAVQAAPTRPTVDRPGMTPRPPLPSAQAAAAPRPATTATPTATQPAMGPAELPSDWKFGMAVPRTVWKAGDDPNKNPNNPIITHMVKTRDALFKRDGTEQPEIQDKITRASRGQAFDPGPFTGWVDESKNVLEGQEDLDAIKSLLGK